MSENNQQFNVNNLVDIETEKSLLRALVEFDNSETVMALVKLKKSHFYDEGHQEIFEVLKELESRNFKLQMEVVRAELMKEHPGLLDALMRIALVEPVAAVLFAVESLEEWQRKRELFRGFMIGIQGLQEGDSSLMCANNIVRVADGVSISSVEDFTSYAQLKEKVENEPPVAKIKTGLSFLDVKLKSGIEFGQFIGVMGDPEAGKMSSYFSTVYTPTGKSTMGSLKVNDFVVGKNGLPTKVVGIYEQGVQDDYEIIFDDGSRATSGAEHLWSVRTRKDRARKRPYRTLELKEIMDDPYMILNDSEGHTRCKYSIPVCDPVAFSKRELEIDPWLLGVFIGDGGLKKSTVILTTPDEEILQRVAEKLPVTDEIVFASKYDYRIRKKKHGNSKTTLKYFFEKHELSVGSWDKFIPEDYKYSSVEDRVALLQGLMDSDGYIPENKAHYEYVTVSERLANDFLELVRGLGGRAVIKLKDTTWTYKKVKKHSKAYRITFSLSPGIAPVSIERKLRDVKYRDTKPLRYIREVNYIGKAQMRCIRVNAEDHLYLTDDFVVTHNTVLVTQMLKYISNSFETLFFNFEFHYRSFIQNNKLNEDKFSLDRFLMESDNNDILDIEAKIKIFAKRGGRVVAIDSQMMITNVRSTGTSSERETEKFFILQRLSIKYDLIILLIAQQGKEDTRSGTVSPMGSKNAAHALHQIWYIKKPKLEFGEYGEDKKKGERTFVVYKNKQTGVHFNKPMKMNPRTFEFYGVQFDEEDQRSTKTVGSGRKKSAPVEEVEYVMEDADGNELPVASMQGSFEMPKV